MTGCVLTNLVAVCFAPPRHAVLERLWFAEANTILGKTRVFLQSQGPPLITGCFWFLIGQTPPVN